MGRPPDHAFRLEGRLTAGTSEPLGDSLAASFDDGTLRVYGPGGDVRRAWKTGGAGFNALAFSPEGTRLVGGDRDGRVVVADARTGREISAFRALEGPVGSLAVSRDASVVASGGDLEVRVFRMEGGRRLFAQSAPAAELSTVALSPDGGRAAVAFTDADVRLVDVATGRVLRTIADLDMAAFSLAFSPDGLLVVCGCADGTVTVRSAETGERVRADVRHAEPVGAVAFSPDGSWVASVGLSMNPATRESAIRSTSLAAQVASSEPLGVLSDVSLGFSPGGVAHVAAPGPGGLLVWDVPPVRKA